MDPTPNLHDISARIFIEHCKAKFGWEDLTSDVIMDVGCGEYGYCGKAILEKFPEVGAIIGIDINPKVARDFRLRTERKIKCVVANIEKRESLRNYEARMTKVISTHVFHQLQKKEEAFQNVYRLLKPGGEAAVLFVMKSLLYDWLTEMLMNPKWKEAYQCHYFENMYEDGTGANQYKVMVENIGFLVVECKEEERVIPYPSDQICKEELYQMCRNKFNISPEMLEEFKEECFQVLLKLSARNAEGKPCYRSTLLSILLVKPMGDSGSRTKETLAC